MLLKALLLICLSQAMAESCETQPNDLNCVPSKPSRLSSVQSVKTSLHSSRDASGVITFSPADPLMSPRLLLLFFFFFFFFFFFYRVVKPESMLGR